jgi:hypothetical protein
MNKRFLATITIPAISLGVLMALTGSALAAPQAITMTPTSVSPVINPGAVYKDTFQVLDQGSTAYAYTIYVTPYHVVGEDYTPDFTALSTLANVTSWFHLSSTGGQINAGDSDTVSYSIQVPKATPPGGYYAVIFAETQYPKSANNITLNERVGEIFYIQVAGTVTQSGKLLSWQSPFWQKPPLLATLRLENDGGVHFDADIKYTVKDILGNTKYSLHTTKEILPQTIRRIDLPWAGTPSLGLFKISGTVSYLGQQLPLPTRWVLVMSTFVRLITASIVGLVIVAYILTLIIRRRRARKARRP